MWEVLSGAELQRLRIRELNRRGLEGLYEATLEGRGWALGVERRRRPIFFIGPGTFKPVSGVAHMYHISTDLSKIISTYMISITYVLFRY